MSNAFGGSWSQRSGKRAAAPPSPPDPSYVADQQMRVNRDASRMSMVDQSGPFGSVSYEDLGDGRFRANQALDPSEVDAVMGARGGANSRLASHLQSYGGSAPDFGNERQRIEDALYKRSAGRLDEQYGRGEESTRSRLLAQGATEGSEAWNNAMSDFNTQKRDDYDHARQSAVIGGGQEQTRLDDMFSRRRGQDFGELGGLFELGRIASLTPRGQGNAGVGPADWQGAAQDQFAGQMGAWRQESANAANNRAKTTQALLSMFMGKGYG